ncbi:MAG: HU family DNA-binding protein [Alphaproteobacteria bacterium]|nr:HU family DNA-binding protein [Alphaproteobacteria bacterium]
MTLTAVSTRAVAIRNPRTDERITIDPSSGMPFKADKALKDALN